MKEETPTPLPSEATKRMAKILGADWEPKEAARPTPADDVRLTVALAIERADATKVPDGYGSEIDHPEVSDWGVFLADAVIASLPRTEPVAAGEKDTYRMSADEHRAMQKALRSSVKIRPRPDTTKVKALVEAARQSQRALKPIADRVFNDNGDHSIATAPFEDEVYSDAYLAERKLSAALKEFDQ